MNPKFNEELTVVTLATAIESIINEYLGEKAVVTAIFDQVEVLYEQSKLLDIAETTMNLYDNQVIASVKAIVASAESIPEKAQATIEKSLSLVDYLLEGKLSAINLATDATLGGIIESVESIVFDYAEESEKVADTFDKLISLTSEVQVVEFVADLLALDSDESLDVAQAIVETITNKEIELVTTLFNIAHAGLSGKWSEVKVDGEAMWNAIPDEFKPYVIMTVAVTGGILYVVANDLLVEIVAGTIGTEEVLGTFIAEPLGFTNAYADGSETNELVNAIFNTKIVDIIDDDFDFKANYYEHLRVDNLSDLVIKLATKFESEEKAKIINAIAGEVAKLCGEAHIIDEIVETTMELESERLLTSVADVVVVKLPEKEDLIYAVKDLVVTLFGGKLKQLGYHGDASIQAVSSAVKAVVDASGNNSETTDAIFLEISKLYENSIINTFVNDTVNLNIDAVILSVASVVDVAVNNEFASEVISDVTNLVTTIVAGKLNKLGINNAYIGDLADAIYEVVNNFAKDNAVLVAVVEEIKALYANSTILSFVADSQVIEIEAVIESVANVVNAVPAISEKDKLTTVEEAKALLVYLLEGKLTSITINKDATLGKTIELVSDIALNYLPFLELKVITRELAELTQNVKFTALVKGLAEIKVADALDSINDIIVDMVRFDNVVLNEVFTQLEGLYADNTFATIAQATLNIELLAIVNATKQVTGKVNGLNDKIARVYVIAESILSGTIGKPVVNTVTLWSILTPVEKTVVIVVGAELGLALYFVANPAFVNLVNTALGADVTWGGVIGNALGYTLNGEHYEINGEVNSLMDIILSTKVSAMATTGYDFLGNLGEHITLGNLFTIAPVVSNVLEGINPDTNDLIKKSYTDWVMNNELMAVSDILFNISLSDILANKNRFGDYMMERISELKLADLGLGWLIVNMNKISPASATNGFTMSGTRVVDTGAWEFEGTYAKLFNVMLNHTLGQVIEAVKTKRLPWLLDDALNKLTVGDVLGETLYAMASADKPEGAKPVEINAYYDAGTGKWTSTMKYANLITKLCNINLREFRAGLAAENIKYLAKAETLGNVRIGELLDNGYNVYNEATGKWSNKDKDPMFNNDFMSHIVEKAYSIKLAEILGGPFNVATLISDLYVGELLGYTCGESHVEGHLHDNECIWYEKAQVYVDGEGDRIAYLPKDLIYEALAIHSVTDFTNGTYDLLDELGEMHIGDLMGYAREVDELDSTKVNYYEYKKVGSVFVVTVDEHGFATKLVDRDAPVNNLTAAIAEVSINEMISGSGVDAIMAKLEGLKLGDIFTYTKKDDGFWYNGTTKQEGIIAKLCDYTLGELKGDFESIINGFKVGEVIHVEGSAILELLADEEIGNLSTAITKLYVGQILGYEKVAQTDVNGYAKYETANGTAYFFNEATETWYDAEGNSADVTGLKLYASHTWFTDTNGDGELNGAEEAVSGVIGVMVNFTIGEMTASDFNDRISTSVQEQKLGDLITIDTSSVLLTSLADTKIKNLGTAINDLKLGQVITIDNNSSSVLKLLANTSISNLSTEMNDLTIGAIMGYTYDATYGWYQDANADGDYDAGEEADDLMKVIMKYKVADMSNGTFASAIKSDVKGMKINYFLNRNDCTIFKLFTEEEFNNLTLNNLSANLTTKMDANTMKVQDLVTLGMISSTQLTAERQATLAELCHKPFDQITVTELFNALFTLLDYAA
ncbi:MAG: hypothetical protein IKJ19_01155 [Clostridia bacterium]|nr:hypothetical protein [Clostridia bacterium]